MPRSEGAPSAVAASLTGSSPCHVLAADEASEPPHLDLLADLGALLGDPIRDGLLPLLILEVRLLEQHLFLVERLQLSIDDLADDVVRFPLLPRLGLVDLAFLLDGLFGHVFAGD